MYPPFPYTTLLRSLVALAALGELLQVGLAVGVGLDEAVGLLVAVLPAGALHEVGARALEGAAHASVEPDLGAADRVDDHAGGVGGVVHLELELDVERHVAEVAALEADQRPLAVVEPRDVVRGADVDVAEIGKHTSELQSLMRISYAVFCLKKKKH